MRLQRVNVRHVTQDFRSTEAEFENLATAYLRLAEQVKRNAALIVEFELPRKEKKS